MLQLPNQYKVKGQRGYLYNLVKREDDVAMSEQFDTEDQRIVSWEVFVIQKYPDRMSPDGKTFIPAKEAPPRSELWGSIGFSCPTLEAAEIRFAQVLASQRAKVSGEPGLNFPDIEETKPVIENVKPIVDEIRPDVSEEGADRVVSKKASRSKKGVEASGSPVPTKGTKSVGSKRRNS